MHWYSSQKHILFCDGVRLLRGKVFSPYALYEIGTSETHDWIHIVVGSSTWGDFQCSMQKQWKSEGRRCPNYKNSWFKRSVQWYRYKCRYAVCVPHQLVFVPYICPNLQQGSLFRVTLDTVISPSPKLKLSLWFLGRNPPLKCPAERERGPLNPAGCKLADNSHIWVLAVLAHLQFSSWYEGFHRDGSC